MTRQSKQATHSRLQAMPKSYMLKYQLQFFTPQNMGEPQNKLTKVEL